MELSDKGVFARTDPADILAGQSVTHVPEEITLNGRDGRKTSAQATGAVAVEGMMSIVAETDSTVNMVPEVVAAKPELVPLYESLLATLNRGYETYRSQIETANFVRLNTAGQENIALLETIKPDIVRAEIEKIIAQPQLLQELQAEIDHFSVKRQRGSPAPGFDIVIVPDGLMAEDELAIATATQKKVDRRQTLYVRSDDLNDGRSLLQGGNGFNVSFAPRHYNIPAGAADYQEGWMKIKNQHLIATELQTATDGQALAQIRNLRKNGLLSNKTTVHDQTYFRRIDQKWVTGCISSIYMDGSPRKVHLGWSLARVACPGRVLIVPKTEVPGQIVN